MTIQFAAITLLTMLSFSAPAIAAAPADEIRQLEVNINEAYANNNLPVYFSYYADDFRGIFPDGFITLETYRKEWTDSVKAGNILVNFTYSDMQIQVSPGEDAAIATYRATASMRYVGKAPVDEHYFETDVFFRRGGVWKLVEVHYSTAAEKK